MSRAPVQRTQESARSSRRGARQSTSMVVNVSLSLSTWRTRLIECAMLWCSQVAFAAFDDVLSDFGLSLVAEHRKTVASVLDPETRGRISIEGAFCRWRCAFDNVVHLLMTLTAAVCWTRLLHQALRRRRRVHEHSVCALAATGRAASSCSDAAAVGSRIAGALCQGPSSRHRLSFIHDQVHGLGADQCCRLWCVGPAE